ncbi:hypothetical protein [Gordonia terrae]|uniref:Mce-associated membrane protein n=2 Tax=Gordonia terrae TaxID=2055 RepID=A0AAD0K7U3_9ACTN|nr:hypothetical protein [Gordonia terrae]VTR06713.1 Uncharacterised protein [Clostridioides difficile]ANY22437.1 hypothetical protein BCM27_06095 [Gordonia terrae]AWO83175.1 hypothetical protein DLJ61_06145 [Gordonia terrae]VTS34506.1 Uncharacterised protein [Gordonia terrae]GAB46480.1 hypothetical protein GOTRE_170_00110 [Gordonia terrae NBRC 100016]
MANDRGKKKPTPKRRPTPKVAGRTSPPSEVRGAKAASLEGPGDATAETDTPLPTEVRGAKAAGPSERSESRSTSHEGPGDDTTEASPTEAGTAGADTIDLAKPATPTPEPTKPKTKPVARVSTLRRGDASAAGSDTSGTPNRPMGRRPGRRDRRGSGASRGPLGIRTGVLAAIAAGLFVVAAILAFHPGAEIGPNKAFVDQESTAQLTSQAQERICAVFGYDHTELDKWQQRAQDALTGQARTEFDETLKAQRDLITQTKTGAECRVDAIGVRDLSGGGDGATATVIANLIVSETQNSMATNSGAPRAQFAMVREGDQWRIRAVEPF